MTQSSPNTIDWPAALQRHRSWLTKILRCRIGDRHEVDDLLQEIALAVFQQNSETEIPDASSTHNGSNVNRRCPQQNKRGGVPSDPDKVAPWLYRLAVRQAVNFHRRANRRTQVKPIPDLEATSEAPRPLDWMLAREQSQHLAQAIAELRPPQREILTLKYTENWSYQEIADHLGVPLRSVEYRLLQARTQLRKLVVNGVTANTKHTSA